jgi:hypothetical protein
MEIHFHLRGHGEQEKKQPGVSQDHAQSSFVVSLH